TADVAVQVSGSNVDRITIVGTLFSVAPQMLAAAWNAIGRCGPRVVRALPPTGATGVGSLKPTPAALPFWMTIVAAACDRAGSPSVAAAIAHAHATGRSLEVALAIIGLPLSLDHATVLGVLLHLLRRRLATGDVFDD